MVYNDLFVAIPASFGATNFGGPFMNGTKPHS